MGSGIGPKWKVLLERGTTMMRRYRYVRTLSVVVYTYVMYVCSENISQFNVGEAEDCRSVGGGRSIQRVKTGVRQININISLRKGTQMQRMKIDSNGR